jgi:lipoprotein-releasing system permease protein
VLASFFKYFFNYIFFAKTRQKLLFLAFIGLFLSSFALLVLQSSMNGLQQSQINRSKNVTGHGAVVFDNRPVEFGRKVSEFLKAEGLKHSLEHHIELLLKHEDRLTPVLVHGVDDSHWVPRFLRKDKLREIIVPFEIAAKLDLELGSKVQLISPSHVDSFFGDIPRSTSLFVEDFISTRVPEVDMLHAWVKLPIIHNLIRDRSVNRLVIYGESDFEKLSEKLKVQFGDKVRIETWESQNKNLVWALTLEAVVMLFLFIAMTLLVSLCITLGLLIFFTKIKGDLASFWIMGSSKLKLEKASWLFLNIMSITAIFSGLIASIIFLLLFKEFGGEIMPENFIDRKIPIAISIKGLLISFIVPYLISLFFSWLSLSQFKRETNYLDQVRAIG